MDEYKDKKKKLMSLRDKILVMPNNIDKAKKIEGYVHLLGYLKEIDSLNIKECKKYDIENDFSIKYDKYVVNKTQKKINEIKDLSPYLYLIFALLIKEYQNNDFCSFEFSINAKVNQDEMYEYIEEFLNLLGKDVVNLYNRMIKNGNIYLMDDFFCLGLSMNSINVDEPCIIIDNFEKYFDYYMTLVHELGHCYQFYLQRNHTHFESFNPFLEVTSLFFEKLFSEFLKTKHKFTKELFDYELEDHIYFLNDISVCKVLCSLFMQGQIFNINAYDLTYSSNIPESKLLQEIVGDCGYIMENKLDISLAEFHYAIGNIMANYFIKKTKKDFYGTLKEFKNFICMVDNYPLEEIIDEYFDLSEMKNDIKKFIKSYRNR